MFIWGFSLSNKNCILSMNYFLRAPSKSDTDVSQQTEKQSKITYPLIFKLKERLKNVPSIKLLNMSTIGDNFTRKSTQMVKDYILLILQPWL